MWNGASRELTLGYTVVSCSTASRQIAWPLARYFLITGRPSECEMPRILDTDSLKEQPCLFRRAPVGGDRLSGRRPVRQEVLCGALYAVVTTDWVGTSEGVKNVSTGVLMTREPPSFERARRAPQQPKHVPAPGASTGHNIFHLAGQQSVQAIFE